MAFVIADRVKETTTSTGTGTITLAGAMAGHSTFASRCAVGDTLYYAIQAVDGLGQPTGEWECGLGTYSSTNVLTRTTVTSSSTSDAAVSFSAGTKQVFITVPAVQAKWPRERLTAARTYYVRTDGNDSNTGLANTAGGAFLTIQKAVDVVAGTLDCAAFQVTIQVGDGTYADYVVLKKPLAQLAPIIIGNTGTPSNVHVSVSPANTSCFTYLTTPGDTASIAGNGYGWDIRSMKLTAARAALECYGSGNVILFRDIDFGVCAFHMLASAGGTIQVSGNYSISGAATYHQLAQQFGTIICTSRTITLLANITVSIFVWARQIGLAVCGGNTYSLGAFAVTGKKFDISENAVVATNGSVEASYLPGSVAGTKATGGLYT